MAVLGGGEQLLDTSKKTNCWVLFPHPDLQALALKLLLALWSGSAFLLQSGLITANLGS